MAPVNKKTVKKYPPLILELTNRRPSAFVMKGTENSENPDRLDCPSEYLLRNRSVVVDDKGVRNESRYIKGCPEFLVKKQTEINAKPNPREDAIVFEFGRLTVLREGIFVGLYDFLANHESNRSNEIRPDGAEDVFYQINTAAEAESAMVDLDVFADAINIVKALREKSGNGFTYDTEKINKYCKLLNVIPLESDAEKLQVLFVTANTNPVFFMDLIKESTFELRLEITTARELGVISTDGDTASFTDEGKGFYKFKEKKDPHVRISELVNYFDKDEGARDLAALKAKVKEKQKALVELA